MFPSKENTEYIVNTLANIGRYSFLPDSLLGLLTAGIHILGGVYILINLVVHPINKNYIYFMIAWSVIIFSNYYFHGCLLSRLERHYFKSKEWCGPVSLFSIFGCDVNKEFANKTIKYWIALPFTSIMGLRIFTSINIFIFLLLALLFTPLIFTHSQELFTSSNNTNISSFQGKTILVTGGSSGIGKEYAEKLSNLGAKVINISRSRGLGSTSNILHIPCDLSSFESVKECIHQVNLLAPEGIDILFNNAGVTNTIPELTKNGYEKQIQINALSHFLLTYKVKYLLHKKSGFVINHSSISYEIPSTPYTSSYFKKHKDLSFFNTLTISQDLYQQSKLSLLLFTGFLNTNGIRAISFQPGMCKTRLFQESSLPTWMRQILYFISDTPESAVNRLCKLSEKFPENTDILYGIQNKYLNKNLINPLTRLQFALDIKQFLSTEL